MPSAQTAQVVYSAEGAVGSTSPSSTSASLAPPQFIFMLTISTREDQNCSVGGKPHTMPSADSREQERRLSQGVLSSLPRGSVVSCQERGLEI